MRRFRYRYWSELARLAVSHDDLLVQQRGLGLNADLGLLVLKHNHGQHRPRPLSCSHSSDTDRFRTGLYNVNHSAHNWNLSLHLRLVFGDKCNMHIRRIDRSNYTINFPLSDFFNVLLCQANGLCFHFFSSIYWNNSSGSQSRSNRKRAYRKQHRDRQRAVLNAHGRSHRRHSELYV